MASTVTRRHDTKHQIITIQTILRSKQLSTSQRDELTRNIQELRKQLETTEYKVDTEEVAYRVRFLKENRGMYDIFHTIWLLFTVYTQDGYLLKEGFERLHHSLQIILAGLPSYSPIDHEAIEEEWTHDKLKYSEINKEAFFDLLFEVIETWCELVDPSYYAAFSWCLLDSLADISLQPPKLRPYREMKCITKVNNEASMLKSYMQNKKVRSALAIQNEVLQRIPEVQKRLSKRKLGVEFDDHIASMVELLSSHYTGTSTFEEEEGSEDAASKGSLKTPGEQDNMWAEDSDDDSTAARHIGDEDTLGAEAVDVISSEGTGGLRERKPGYLEPTSSFMSHINARRESKIMLNGIHAFSMPSVGLHIRNNVPPSALSSIEPSTIRSIAHTGTAIMPSPTKKTTRDRAEQPIDDSFVSKESMSDVLSIPSDHYEAPPDAQTTTVRGKRLHEKARFTEFVTSGRSLASFARDFLLKHEGSSELPIDKFIDPRELKYLDKKAVIRMIAPERLPAKTRGKPAFKGGGKGSSTQLASYEPNAQIPMGQSLIEGKKMKTPAPIVKQPSKTGLMLHLDPAESLPTTSLPATSPNNAMLMFEPDATRDYSVYQLDRTRVSSSQWRLLKGKKVEDDASSYQSRSVSTAERRRTIYPVNSAVPVRTTLPSRRVDSPPGGSSWDINNAPVRSRVGSPLMRSDISSPRRRKEMPLASNNNNIASSPKKPRPYSPYTDEIPAIVDGEVLSDGGDTPLRYQQRSTLIAEGSGLKMGSTSLHSVSKLDLHQMSATLPRTTTTPIATIRKIDFLNAIKKNDPGFVSKRTKTSKDPVLSDDLSSISSLDGGTLEDNPTLEEIVNPVTIQDVQQKVLQVKNVHSKSKTGRSTTIRPSTTSRIKMGGTTVSPHPHASQKSFVAIVTTDSTGSRDWQNADLNSNKHRAVKVAKLVDHSAINHDLRFDEKVKKHNIRNIERAMKEKEKLSSLSSALVTAPLSTIHARKSNQVDISNHPGNTILKSGKSSPVEVDHDSVSDKGFLKSLEGKHFRDSFQSLLSIDEDNIQTQRSDQKNDDKDTNKRRDSTDSLRIPEVTMQSLDAYELDEVSSVTSLSNSMMNPSRQSLVIKSTSSPALGSPPRGDSNNNINNSNNNDKNNYNSNNPKQLQSPDAASIRTGSSPDPPSKATTTTLTMPMVHHTNKALNKKILHKNIYVDDQGKLQGENFFIEKSLFETLRDADLVEHPLPDFNAMKLQQKGSSAVVIKHPYLALPGVKPVSYPKELNTITSMRQPYSVDTLHSQFHRLITAPQLNLQTIADTRMIEDLNKKQASHQLKAIAENKDDIALVEPMFLGNSSAYIVSSDMYSSYTRSKSAPWLPNGSLEPLETNRSNWRLGMQEKLDLMRHAPHDPSRQIMMVKGQEAARNAFENFVGTYMH